MKTKCVYVLVSTSKDFYLEQTLISAYSLRLHNPSAIITIVADRDTFNSLDGKRKEIKKYVSEFIVLDCPEEYNGMQKSRYIKTNLRKFVSGDFLYLDSDTVVSDSLEEIDSFDGDLGAVLESNRCLPIGETGYASDVYINEHLYKLGWPRLNGYYNFNGGVIFARDSDVACNFYNRWNELWLECTKQGVYIDMIALCRANKELGVCIKVLPNIWNCQIQRQGLPFLPEAKIIHCFTGGNLTMYSLCTERVLQTVKMEGSLNEEVISMIKNSKNAFEESTTIIPTRDAHILQSPLLKLLDTNRLLFRILNKMAKFYFYCRLPH